MSHTLAGFLLKAASLAATYLLAWLLVFYTVVGNDPQLITTYFILGWMFSGLELPTFVWLCAWPVFGAFLLAYYYTGAALSRWRQRRHCELCADRPVE